MIDDETLEKFERTIDILEFEEVDILVRAEKGIKIIKEVLNKTRNSVVNRSFKSRQKEIHFFKVVKPKVFSKLILDLQQKSGQLDKSHAADFWLYISFSNSTMVL